MQSDSVPTCSRAVEVVANPPRPTQNAEYADPDPRQFAFGCTQVAVTSEKASGWSVASAPPIVAASLIAYPAQFELTDGVMSRSAAAAGLTPAPSTTAPNTARAVSVTTSFIGGQVSTPS